MQSWTTFPENVFVASRCVVNLKPVPQAEAPGQVNRLFYMRRMGCVSVCSMCYVLGEVA